MIGPEQFGFRKGRSTVDAVFVLTTLLKKARAKGGQYKVAFLDISKVGQQIIILVYVSFIFQAYDSVWREGLYSKLESVGFGGKTLKIIKSMYCNDSLKFLINGKFSDSLWITRGVKQGV